MTVTVSGGLELVVPSPHDTNYHEGFVDNFATPIATHDHTSGKGTAITTAAIANNAVTGAKIRLANNEWLKALNAAGSGTVNIVKVDATDGVIWHGINPAGTIRMFAGAVLPAGNLWCDGSTVSRTTYADLFAAIGTTYNTGGEAGTDFRLPNLKQRFPIGVAASGTANALGATGGAIDHTHTVPAHQHAVTVTGTAAEAGAHQHAIAEQAQSAGGLGEATSLAYAYDASNDYSYELRGSLGAATIGLTSSTGAHTHDVTGSGTAGSGVNGDAQMTSGTNNPPFLALNFIISY